MHPLRIKGATRTLAKNQPEYMQLAIRDHRVQIKPGEFINMMTSAWEIGPPEVEALVEGDALLLEVAGAGTVGWLPSQVQLEQLISGGSVLISVSGYTHPPIRPHVGSASEATVKIDGRDVQIIGNMGFVMGTQPAPALEDA